MTNEEKLEKAKKDYPKGTVCRSAVTESIFTSQGEYRLSSISSVYENESNRCIYSQSANKWAEIISKPEMSVDEKLAYAKQNYPKGTKFTSAWELSDNIHTSSGDFRVTQEGRVVNNPHGIVFDEESKKWGEILFQCKQKENDQNPKSLADSKPKPTPEPRYVQPTFKPTLSEHLKSMEKSEFQQIGDSVVKLLEYKNKKYGKSALNPINVFNGKSKVGQRADDKISRIQNNPVLQKNDVVDLIGYLILICQENDWKTFDEFMD